MKFLYIKIGGNEIRQILAIAQLTLKENLRSRVFLALFVTGIVVTSVSVAIPVVGDIEEKVKLVESMCLRSISFFGMLIGAILAAASVPKEIEDRSLYSVVTKPVRWLNLILGKIIGLIFIAGITVVFLGCLSVILTRHVVSRGLDEGAVAAKLGDNVSEPGPSPAAAYGNLNIVAADSRSYSRLIARRQTSSVSFSINGKHHETPAGIKWIEGGGKGAAIWDVSGLQAVRLGKQIEVEMNPYFEGGEAAIPLEVSVRNTATNQTETVTIDAPIGKKLIMEIDSQIVRDADRIIMEVSPKYPGQYIGLREEDVKIFYNYRSFEWNFVKAVIIVSLQIVLIIFIGATASTFLVTPSVSMLLALFIFFCGYMVDYIKDISSVMINVPDLHDHGAPHEAVEPGVLVTIFNLVVRVVLDIVAYVVPNFDKFNVESFILDRIDIPFKRMLALLGYASIYLCACMGISAIATRKKEV